MSDEKAPQEAEEAWQFLAEWAGRFSPLTGARRIQDGNLVWLDLRPVIHLYPSEEAFLARVFCELLKAGIEEFAAVVTESPSAAAAMAEILFRRFVRSRSIPEGPQQQPKAWGMWVAPLASRRVVGRLPIDALPFPPAMREDCRELGIKRVTTLLSLPREHVVARWGEEAGKHLDRLLGKLPEPLPPWNGTPRYAGGEYFEPPLKDEESLAAAMRSVLQRILEDMRQDGRGILELECRLQFESRTTCRLRASVFRPCDDSDRLMALLTLEAERQCREEAVAGIHMSVVRDARLVWRQQALFSDTQRQDEIRRNVERLLERLLARLGDEHVCFVEEVPEATPERTMRLISVRKGVRRKRRWNPKRRNTPPRPLRLLESPVPIFPAAPQHAPPRFVRIDGRTHRIVRWWGPERIETGWWRNSGIARDYFQLETEDGCRLWVFRDLKTQRWFRHGWFD
ncbi:MAG: hypothetical protein D6741_02745 [Planctomycetota bacterium]|nr:MAG: hypothetical protein D6741_02745 [Planctomycetota bacterium]